LTHLRFRRQELYYSSFAKSEKGSRVEIREDNTEDEVSLTRRFHPRPLIHQITLLEELVKLLDPQTLVELMGPDDSKKHEIEK
jgi:hypothetical protein